MRFGYLCRSVLGQHSGFTFRAFVSESHMMDQKNNLRLERLSQSLAAPRADHGLTVSDVFHRVLAHRWFIVACAVTCLALSWVYILRKPPIYEASAILRIDPTRAGSLGLTDTPAPAPAEPDDDIHTEIVILKSDGVAIRALNSLRDDEFLRFTGSSRNGALIPEEVESLTYEQQRLINKLEKQLTVKQIDGTELIAVTVKDKDPEIAASLDNNIVKAYARQNFENRNRSVSQLRTWLSAQMNDLKNQVNASQKALANFEQENHVIDTGGASNTIADRLHFLSEQLSTAQANRITKEGEMHAAQVGSPSELASLFPNPKLSTLQSAQGTLYAQYAQLSTKFGAKYPPLENLTKQMQQIDSEIAVEVQSARNRLRQEYEAAKQAQDMLQAEYDRQAELAYGFSRNQASYAVLQADVTTSRDLYDIMRRKLQQATVDTEIGGLNTTLVQSARVPTEPAGPRKFVLLGGGLLLGLFAGIVAAFVFEATSDRVQSTSQIEGNLGIPVLASVPSLRIKTDHSITGGRRNEPSPSLLMLLGDPSSRYSEAVRALRNSVLLAPDVKTLLVASSIPGEGSSATAANLATVLAQPGVRVLLIDADVLNPEVHTALGFEKGAGLSDYLADLSTPLRIAQPVAGLDGLHVVTGGSPILLSSDALASTTFHALMLEWRRDFDYVVLTCAPFLVASASTLVASWADATVLVTRYNESRLADLKQVGDLLSRSGATVAGVVINDLPSKTDRWVELARNQEENSNAQPDLADRMRTAQ
jgi:succinoglycan biosynthesis transport protein ExoP